MKHEGRRAKEEMKICQAHLYSSLGLRARTEYRMERRKVKQNDARRHSSSKFRIQSAKFKMTLSPRRPIACRSDAICLRQGAARRHVPRRARVVG